MALRSRAPNSAELPAYTSIEMRLAFSTITLREFRLRECAQREVFEFPYVSRIDLSAAGHQIIAGMKSAAVLHEPQIALLAHRALFSGSRDGRRSMAITSWNPSAPLICKDSVCGAP